MAEEMLSCANQTFTLVKNEHDSMEGEIAIFTTPCFGGLVTRWMNSFLEEHPNVNLEIVSIDKDDPNLMLGEAEIAISSYRPQTRETISCQPLCQYPFAVYASQSYLDKEGYPKRIQDLDAHHIIAWKESHLITHPENTSYFNMLLYAGRKKDHPRKPHIRIGSDDGISSAVSE